MAPSTRIRTRKTAAQRPAAAGGASTVAVWTAVLAAAAAVTAAGLSAWLATDYDSRKENLKLERETIEAVAELSECVVQYGRTPRDWTVATALLANATADDAGRLPTANLASICASVKLQPLAMAPLLSDQKRLAAAVERLCQATHRRLLSATEDYLRQLQPAVVQEKGKEKERVMQALRQAQFALANVQAALETFTDAVQRLDAQCGSGQSTLRPKSMDALVASYIGLPAAGTESLPSGGANRSLVIKGAGFGFRLDPFTQRVALHTGQDYMAPTGTPVLAALAGRAQTQFHMVYGLMTEISGPEGTTIRYAHLSRARFKDNEEVAAGDWIGNVGATGRTTGPQLHVELLKHGVPQDPAGVLDMDRLFQAH